MNTKIEQIHTYIQNNQQAMVDLLAHLVRVESPSLVPQTQLEIQTILKQAFAETGYQATFFEGRETGGHLYFAPESAKEPADLQLLVGHSDTVWPAGTLADMPFTSAGNIIKGPGVYDMKAGLVEMIFALRALQTLDLTPAVAPVCFINSDEEIGSPESGPIITEIAQTVCRAFILEPGLGLEGKMKTARKGIARYMVTVNGRAAHAGLDPEKGVSAILAMAQVIEALFALNDAAQGITVNVGTVHGGVQSNVIAPSCQADVDVRVPTLAAARKIHTFMKNLKPALAGATIEVRGDIERPPLEKTAANQVLWQRAQEVGQALGIVLNEGMAGGGSDGNITSQYTATLDGLGAVGDGAHASHEFIYRDKFIERTVLLAHLLLLPRDH